MKKKNIGDPNSELANKRSSDNEQFNAYSSRRLIEKRLEKIASEDEYLKKKITKSGKSAFELKKTNLAKFTELYIQLIALEELADEQGMTWTFITLTAPPEYHSNPSRGRDCWSGKGAKKATPFSSTSGKTWVSLLIKPTSKKCVFVTKQALAFV